MPFNYQLSKEAESDIEDAYFWYEKQKEGLGEELLEALDAAKEAIIKSPATYRIRYKKKVRAFGVERFPYLIVYIVNKKDVDVISVFHTNQHPKKWKKRVRRLPIIRSVRYYGSRSKRLMSTVSATRGNLPD